MTPSKSATPSRAELRRQQANERRKLQAAELVQPDAQTTTLRAPLSFAARSLSQAFPRELVDQGLIAFDQQGQPRVASYDPSLLAPNPQRARIADGNLTELAQSLSSNGQQEPLVARLITHTDRQRWPDAFASGQLLLILKGHRIYQAQKDSTLKTLRVELMLPEDGESDLDYSRRALRRVSIRLMHSQAYTIFDKVNLYTIWRQEYALPSPRDAQVAAFFEISRTEAQRVKAVAEMDESVIEEIKNAERKPADEVIFTIARQPREEQRTAYQRYGHLTVAAVRSLEQSEKPKALPAASAGRPRNYGLSVRDVSSPIMFISTNLTPQQWKRKGGARAFLDALRALAGDKEMQERLREDLD